MEYYLITSMSCMFSQSDGFNDPNINYWDTSNVIALAFNEPLNNWNTKSLVTAASMFDNSGFNGDISTWITKVAAKYCIYVF